MLNFLRAFETNVTFFSTFFVTLVILFFHIPLTKFAQPASLLLSSYQLCNNQTKTINRIQFRKNHFSEFCTMSSKEKSQIILLDEQWNERLKSDPSYKKFADSIENYWTLHDKARN